MTQRERLKAGAGWVEEKGINYMVTGGYSVIYYGRVRTSHDLDFIVEMGLKEKEKIVEILSRGGDDFSFQPDAIEEAVEKKWMFTVMYFPASTKIDFWILKDTDFDKLRFKRRVRVDAWGQKVLLSSPEDTILQKLRWYEMGKIEKHLVDGAISGRRK